MHPSAKLSPMMDFPTKQWLNKMVAAVSIIGLITTVVGVVSWSSYTGRDAIAVLSPRNDNIRSSMEYEDPGKRHVTNAESGDSRRR